MKNVISKSPVSSRLRKWTALSAIALASQAGATINTALQMQLGNATGATVNSANHNNYLLQRTVDAVDYNDTRGVPNWVSWDLTSADIGSSGRSSSFYQDTLLPTTFNRLTDGDYTNSGFDRGHMCPSYDRTDILANNKLVFFMSNIIPQMADNNQGPWQDFEAYCQTLAQAGNELLITSGPSLFTGSYIQPSGEAAIPGYTWKFVLVVPSGSGTALSRVTTSTRVIALKMPNIAGIRNNPWTSYVTSINQLQTDTGYSFLSAVPAATATVLRAKVDGVVAAAPTVASFSPSSAAVGTAVTVTGTNFTSASSVKFNGTTATFTVNSATSIATTVPAGATTGKISVTTPGGTATSSANFTVTASGGTGGLKISQVYGGGGNSGATYKNDFVELYNGGSTTVTLSTYSIQYASSTGSSWSQVNLTGSVLPGHYYLIQLGAGGSGTTNLPTPQASGTVNMSASAGKVALTKTLTLLAVSDPTASTNVVDFVGFGTANAYEGTSAAPTLSATTAALRGAAGLTDTNNNGADFSAAAPVPRNN